MNINTASTIPYSAIASSGTLIIDDLADVTTQTNLSRDANWKHSHATEARGVIGTFDPIEIRWEDSPYEKVERRIEALEAKLKLVAPYIPEDIDVGELL